jgi:hypothetical protein
MDMFKEWIKEPYKTDMDAQHWFAFVGLLIMIMFLWRFILSHLRGAIA